MADHIDSISTESESGLYCAQREPFAYILLICRDAELVINYYNKMGETKRRSVISADT